jgi:hypothetical protein
MSDKDTAYLDSDEHNEALGAEALLADGFEAAFIGFGVHYHAAVAIYDTRACLNILQTRDGMSEDEALEFFEFNVVGAWVGPHTPVFMMRPRRGWTQGNGVRGSST